MSGHVNVRIRCVKKAFINNMKKELIYLTSRTLAVINILQLEGTVGDISSDPPFVECCVRFTTDLFTPRNENFIYKNY